MLAPVLVTEDPYAAASVFCQAGWKLEYETPAGRRRPRACVSLAQARVVLVTPQPRPAGRAAARAGSRAAAARAAARAEWTLPAAPGDRAAPSPYRLGEPSGERGFRAEIVGYRFLIIGRRSGPRPGADQHRPADRRARGRTAAA